MAYRGIDAAARENQYGPATDLSRWSLEVNEGQQVSEVVTIYRNRHRNSVLAGPLHPSLVSTPAFSQHPSSLHRMQLSAMAHIHGPHLSFRAGVDVSR